MNGTSSMDNLTQRIKFKLIEIRKAKEMTQGEFAELLNIPRSTYSRLEKGSNTPDLFSLFNICHALNISADYLLGLSETHDPVFHDLARYTGLSEEALCYLKVERESEPLGDPARNPTRKTDVIDLILRDADFKNVFDYQNPVVSIDDSKEDFFSEFISKRESEYSAEDAGLFAPDDFHILDLLKAKWDDPSNVLLGDSWHDWDEAPVYTSDREPEYDSHTQDYLHKHELHLARENEKTHFLDKLIDYLLFDSAETYLVVDGDSELLTSKKKITLQMGDRLFDFPSDECMKVLENQLLQNVIDSLRALKVKYRNRTVENSEYSNT